ncbi:MAG TPA: chitinase N-terminal domain-containing protein [Xanthomonadales bacterium]|nr:chitinase N-terminal domain-containing protein [Xanthomonadales bacterium]
MTKQINRNRSTNVRLKAVFPALMLAGSTSAFAQAPTAPKIDWMDFHATSQDSDTVDLDVGWSISHDEPADSVQYRVDGIPVKARSIAHDQYQGEAVLPIGREDVFDFTIAICNSDGCGETDPVSVSLSGTDKASSDANTPFNSMNGAEIEAELERIRINTEWVRSYYDLPQRDISAGQTQVTGLLASELGKAALSGIVRAGADVGFQVLMGQLGLGRMSFSNQVGELHDSIDALANQISDLTLSIEELQDQTSWQGFLNQHKDANSAVNMIYGNFESVIGWLENGIEPDYAAWTNARKNIDDSLTILAGAALNPGGGIIDMRDGAIFQLINAIPQRVASVESYWPLVDEYRDFYRAAIAVGYLGLDLIEDNFDGTGTTRVLADQALSVGKRATLAMYTYGVAPELPEGNGQPLDLAQLRGSVDGYASAAFASHDERTNRIPSASTLSAAMSQMASDYRPEHHGGLSLEAFLAESNIPTSFVIENSGGWHGTGWHVHKVSLGSPHQGIPPAYEIKPLVGEMTGNNWSDSYQYFCHGIDCMFGGDLIAAWTDSQIREGINHRKGQLRSLDGYTLNNGRYAVTHYGAVDLTDRLNHAGRMAEFDPELVRLAAFGDGVASLPRAVIPGGNQNGSIGASDANIMNAGDYSLDWQLDGNLVLRDLQGMIVWQTGTSHQANELVWQTDGNLVLRMNGLAIWASATADAQQGGFGGQEFKLHPNGELQIVNEHDQVIWQGGVVN